MFFKDIHQGKDQPSLLTSIPFVVSKGDSLKHGEGSLGGSVVEHLPLAQGVIPGSRDQDPCRAPCMEPASPSAYVSAPLSLCLS